MKENELSKVVKSHLCKGRLVQLATLNGDQPWVCSVYFVSDDELNVYWLSLPTRRHSIEIEKNNKVATTMAIKIDQPIIGLGAEGVVDIVTDEQIVEKVMPKYIEKYDNGKDFFERFKAGANEHVMYRFKPTKFVLVDEVNFPGEGSIDWIPN